MRTINIDEPITASSCMGDSTATYQVVREPSKGAFQWPSPPAGTTLDAEETRRLIKAHQDSLRWIPGRSFEQYVSERIAPDGKLWLCYACGKTTRDRYGESGGWDEACALNSGLVDA